MRANRKDIDAVLPPADWDAVSSWERTIRACKASWPERKRLAAIAGEIPHTVKPDCDNCVNSVLNALNTVAFLDDKLVVRVVASKAYGASSLTVATVKAAPTSQRIVLDAREPI